MNNKIKIKNSVIENEETVNFFLSLGNRDYVLTSLHGLGANDLSPNDFEEYEIPKNALCAIESYWSCLSTVIYVTKDGDKISVKEGSKSADGGLSEKRIYEEIFSLDINQ